MRAEALPPRAECPEPGRWTAPDEWATETEVSALLGNLVRALKPDLIVETGSYHGDTAAQLGMACQSVGRGHVVTIELDALNASIARDTVANLPVSVVTGRGLSYQPLQPIDLLFVDSGFSDRCEEIRHFAQFASPRCVIALHDSALPVKYPGVAGMNTAMIELVDTGLITPWLYLPTPRGLALARYR